MWLNFMTRSSKLFFVTFLFSVLIFILSCEVQDCGCFNNSEINGKWSGFYLSPDTTVELTLNIAEKNSIVEGSGSLFAKFEKNYYEQILTCKGSFVSRKLVLTFYEVDSLSYEGYLLESKDSISGKLYFKYKPLFLGLKKLK